MGALWLHHPAVGAVAYNGAKIEVAHLWVDWLHHPYRQGGPAQRDIIRKGPHVSRLATSTLPPGGSPTRGQNQQAITCERIPYIILAVCGVPNKKSKSQRE